MFSPIIANSIIDFWTSLLNFRLVSMTLEQCPGMHGIHVLYMIEAQLDPLPDVSAQHHVPYLYAGRVSLVTCMPVRA